MDYMTAFDTAFTDTTRQQTAQAQLKHLWMKNDDLDTYISVFKHLAQDAGYNLTAMGTADLFALGLRKKLFDVCMYRQMQPGSFNDWVTATKEELIKRARRYTMQESAYQFRPYHGKSYQAANGHQHYIHPNDRVVPMEVDQPVTTYIRRASTEADKQRLREQGKCFCCEAFGHMVLHLGLISVSCVYLFMHLSRLFYHVYYRPAFFCFYWTYFGLSCYLDT
jgi:hypothetical protein